MWWLIPVGIGGLATLIYGAVSDQERKARQRWEEMRWDVEQSLKEHSENIEAHFYQAQHSYNFHVLVDEHYSSMQAANAAHKLLVDARSSENGINKMLKATINKRTSLRERLKEAKKAKNKTFIFFSKTRQQTHKALIQDIEGELKDIREMRESFFEDRDKVKAQKVSFLKEVRRLNERTRKLKELIRDECGSRGLDWYNRLEERTRRRRLSEGKS